MTPRFAGLWLCALQLACTVRTDLEAFDAGGAAAGDVEPVRTVQISATTDFVSATESGPIAIDIVVQPPAPRSLTVAWRVLHDTTDASDLVAGSGTTAVSEGDARATLSVALYDDTTIEGIEVLQVELRPGAGYTIAPPNPVTVRIIDDDDVIDLTTGAEPSARAMMAAVWADTGLFVWGGHGANWNTSCSWSGPELDDGGFLDWRTLTWTPLPSAVAGLARRRSVSAVWTGTEVILWGGCRSWEVAYADGVRWDPTTNVWTPVSGVGAPGSRAAHSATWTGTHMLIFGGYDGNDDYSQNDGGLYDPLTDTWTPLTTVDAPPARYYHSAVWTGSELIVFGGRRIWNDDTRMNTGGIYDPDSDTWTATSLTGAPSARTRHTAVWTGERMLVWGGDGGGNSGGSFDPTTNTWTPLSTTDAPTGRDAHTAVWTGERMLIWGGCCSLTTAAPYAYDPRADSWLALDNATSSVERYYHAEVWTNGAWLLFGGYADDVPMTALVLWAPRN